MPALGRRNGFEIDIFIAATGDTAARLRAVLESVFDDPQLVRDITAVLNLWQRLSQPTFPPGGYRHHSVEHAFEQRTVWERRTVERLQRDRHPR